MEITTNQLKCKECNSDIQAQTKFCPNCGNHVIKALRSENEVKAMIETIKNYKPPDGDDAIAKLIMVFPIILTLNWVIGGNISPMTLIEGKKK